MGNPAGEHARRHEHGDQARSIGAAVVLLVVLLWRRGILFLPLIFGFGAFGLGGRRRRHQPQVRQTDSLDYRVVEHRQADAWQQRVSGQAWQDDQIDRRTR